FLLVRKGSIPEQMVRVPGGDVSLELTSLEHLPPVRLSDFLMDRYEVTNKQFKLFVDSGGYEKRQYWRRPFGKDGRVLSWRPAVADCRGRAGRMGPAG